MQLPLFDFSTSIPVNKRLILSLYDYTGQWAQPYIDAGYPVILWDLKYEGDILEGFTWLMIRIEQSGLKLYGILSAPPCTQYSVSGNQWWPKKDMPKPGFEPFESETELSDALVQIVLHLVEIYRDSLVFWVMENPVGRIEQRNPEIKPFRRLLFNPCDYGDPYTKKTILWGEFNKNLKRNEVEPIMYELNGKKGSYMWAKLGGKSERTKSLRSTTPPGFAQAFFEANQ